MAIDKITADGIADNAIGTSKIGADVIVAEDIAANAITVSEIQDAAVTHAKLHTDMDLTSKTVSLSDLNITGSTPRIVFTDTGNPVGDKKFHVIPTTTDGHLRFQALNDSGSGGGQIIEMRREERQVTGLALMNGTDKTFFSTADNTTNYINNGGGLGIGTTTPDVNSFGAGHGILAVASQTGSAKTAMLNLIGDGNDTADARVASVFFNDASASGAGATLAGVEAYRASNHATDPGADLVFSTNSETTAYTEKMRITSEGYVTAPNQPSFYAYPSVSQSYTADVWNVVEFDTTGWNVGGHYNTSNYRWTVPVAGKYLINWMLQLEDSNQPTWIYAYPIVNNNRNAARGKGVVFADFRVSTNYHTESGSWIMNLAANDFVTFDIHTSGSTKNFKGESHWSGILLS